MLVLSVLGVLALGVAAVLAFTGGGEEPQGIASTDDTREVTTTDPPATTATSVVEAVDESTDEPADESCLADPGIAVLAQGIVEGFPPGEEQDGLFIFGSAASVEFRLDAPGNRDLILFRLVPETDFTIDLPGEEVEREFFEDPSCYPTPTEEP